MSELLNHQAMKVVCKGPDSEGTQSEPEMMKDLGRKGSVSSQLEKINAFFQICDSEGKGYITPTDMQRLNKELPLSAEELENVFESLDLDRNGRLTLEEFSSGFSHFLKGRSMSQAEDQLMGLPEVFPETLYQAEPLNYEEESHFNTLMESLGASNIFEDPGEVRTLWMQLRKDEPHLLYNFEDFLARVTSQMKEAQQEKREMESALRKKAATHNGEIKQLYEEMEQQIKHEQDLLSHKAIRSQDLQQQLSSKVQELEQLFLRQRKLEQQCQELHSEHQESQLENIKLKITNQELSDKLEHTCTELSLAQEQLANLQEKGLRQEEEKEMAVYRITERLQREKQTLIHQLDLLREMNKHLRDEKESLGTLAVLLDQRQATGSDATEVTQHPNRKNSSCSSPHTDSGDKGMMTTDKHTVSVGGDSVTDNPHPNAVDSPPLQRIISIEEDHFPHLLKGEPYSLFLNMTELDMEGALIDLQMSPMCIPNTSLTCITRGQPGSVEAFVTPTPQRLFKVILVGNSSVGKTAILHRFCDGHFHTDTTATVGIDYSVQTLNLGGSRVVLQLWDTAGQERFRSITKQFFRKADGVVVTYDITMRDSFKSVCTWLVSIQESVGGAVPIMLLGNKSDRESMRQVATREGEKLAKDKHLLFYECSAYTGFNVLEAMVHLARVLKEQEDRVRENTVRLVEQPVKKKTCCM